MINTNRLIRTANNTNCLGFERMVLERPIDGRRSRLEPTKTDRREVFKVRNMADYSITKAGFSVANNGENHCF